MMWYKSPLLISSVHLTCEPSNPEKSKVFIILSLKFRISWLSVLSPSEEFLGTRIQWTVLIKHGINRDNYSFGWDRNQDSYKTDSNWRKHLATERFDDCLPKRGDNSFEGKHCNHMEARAATWMRSHRL